MRTRRLFWQLYPSYLLITLVSLLVVAVYASVAVERFYRRQTAVHLRARAYLVEEQFREELAQGQSERIDALCKRLGPRSSTRITVILPSGEVVGDSEKPPAEMDNHADREEIREALAGRVGSKVRYSFTMEQDMMYVAVPVEDGGTIIGVLRTSVPVTAVEATVAMIHWRIAVAGFAVAVIAAGVSLLVARRIVRPLEEIQRGAERFARGDLRHKLPTAGTRELAALAEAMNQMAAQLDDRIRTVLQQRNEREAVLSSMVEGVLAVDRQECVVSVNQAGAELLGVDPQEAEGRSLQEIVRDPDLQRLVAEVLESQQPRTGDIRMALAAGEERHLNAQGTVLRDARQSAIGAVLVLHDVTRIKRLELVRRDFVANVSHELRTPVTSIKGFVETLIDGAKDDPQEADRFLRIVARQADRLNAIIEDLLTLSRVEQEAETREIALDEGPIRDVLEAAVAVCRSKADGKDIRLEVACDGELHAPINPPLLEQAVVNLVDNALKYSLQGQTVQVDAVRTENEVVIRVRDHGCGISREHLPRIFERFYRVDRARSRELGGTGLGLSIVKHIAQSHGGRATVRSTPGEGSTFCIHLPGG